MKRLPLAVLAVWLLGALAGCSLPPSHGPTAGTRFIWKNTTGELALRSGHEDDAWGYHSTDGLGLLEYLEWCEDLHAIPVLAVNGGYSLAGDYIPAGPALKPYVRDALDEIQYATGSTATPWGARRAADGHPTPFSVPYVEIGNEDFFDRGAMTAGSPSSTMRSAPPTLQSN